RTFEVVVGHFRLGEAVCSTTGKLPAACLFAVIAVGQHLQLLLSACYYSPLNRRFDNTLEHFEINVASDAGFKRPQGVLAGYALPCPAQVRTRIAALMSQAPDARYNPIGTAAWKI
ncbi:MAG TPA: hypothetical protein VK419_10155, partial [Bryobacteraceae bacterium]|nr:hypothetical protein [Bryobacteraceae bacterium]